MIISEKIDNRFVDVKIGTSITIRMEVEPGCRIFIGILDDENNEVGVFATREEAREFANTLLEVL